MDTSVFSYLAAIAQTAVAYIRATNLLKRITRR